MTTLSHSSRPKALAPAKISTAVATGTIIDDDLEPLITAKGTGTVEGGQVSFTVSLSEPSSRTVKVKVRTVPGKTFPATSGTDYTPVAPQTLIFAAGETSKAVVFATREDLLDEDDERVGLELSEPLSGRINGVVAEAVIIDNDNSPSFSIDDVSVIEGHKNTTAATFTVTLSAPSGRETSVDFTTANGTAVAVADFVGIGGSLTFVPGQVKQKISVQVKGETTFEADEQFRLVLSKSRNATVTKTTGLGTIINDDKAPAVKSSANSF
ncbi:hypothetical protein EON80_02525 [bacterium]|nr:MAG: hypothetical protein EON80_02525 [bacterium]